MKNFDLRKYLAEGRLYENNDSVGMINYLKSLPDQYDMSDSQYDLWEDTMESIEGFTSQEIKNYIKDLPNLWDMSGSQYDLWEDIMDNFDLKKDLAEGKLNEENYEPGRGWTNNFDYDGMLNLASIFDINTPMDILLKVSSDMEDVNYHRENSYLTDAIDAIKDGNKQEAFIAFRMLKKEIAKLQESEIKERKPIVKNTKMKKSELKEIIKAALSEDTMHESAEKWNKLSNDQKLDLLLQAYKDPDEAEEYVDYTWDELPDVATQNMRLKEGDFVNEAEEVDVEDNEEVDVDIEKDVEIDDESVESDIEVKGSMPGEDADEVAVQSLLMKAQEEAAKLGDEKLTDQIGNTITYFTRAHVATVDEDVNEETDYDNTDAVSGDINVTNDNPAADAEIGLALNEEVVRFKKLAGIIK